MLEAGDLTSLLEQFEATEAAISSQTDESLTQNSSNKMAKTVVNKSQQSLLKKSVAKQDVQKYNCSHEILPKDVIDRIKVKASSGRRKGISVIPAIPKSKPTKRKRGKKTQEDATKNAEIVINC